MPTRREFIQWTAASGAGLAVGGGLLSGRARAAPTASVAGGLTPYLDPMPTLTDNAIDATGGGTVNLTTRLITRQVHSQLLPTTLFGYEGGPNDGASYLGPVIIAKSKSSVTVKYPGQVTVVRARYIPPSTLFDSSGHLTMQTQKYVHHCHIVEHEDNDMMERVEVTP